MLNDWLFKTEGIEHAYVDAKDKFFFLFFFFSPRITWVKTIKICWDQELWCREDLNLDYWYPTFNVITNEFGGSSLLKKNVNPMIKSILLIWFSPIQPQPRKLVFHNYLKRLAFYILYIQLVVQLISIDSATWMHYNKISALRRKQG